MPNATLLASVDTFVNAIALLEPDHRHDTPLQHGSTAAGAPHLICAIGERDRIEFGEYEAPGYARSAEWTMMARPLTGRLSEPADDRAVLIEDAATETRVMTATLAAGDSGHPTLP